ncbi:MAG: hypothetical protein GY808_03260 [Gammaproteobacteria bacterium]|nr:hypothetical protein [Gammaproteobacteria bacterium]
MTNKLDRLKRIQQRLWRKAAASILSLHHNLVIILSFLLITAFGSFWIFIDQKLETQLLKSITENGYSISRYAAADLRPLILSKDKQSQESYLNRLTSHPLIISARLFDHQGALLTENHASSEKSSIESDILTLLEDIYGLHFTDQQNDQKRIGILQLQMDKARQKKPIQTLMDTIAIITIIVMVLSIIIAWFVSKHLTKPLRNLLKSPINAPGKGIIEKLDVATELKLMLESSSSIYDSPAPVSNAEASGIHQLLSVDSVAEIGEVIILKLYLSDLAKWLTPASGSPNVQLLRRLDRLLIVTIHSQQGHLLAFDGITAQACFGLDGNLSSATFRATSCSILIKELLRELTLEPRICLRKEERLLIRHMKRTPIAIPIHDTDDMPSTLFTNNNHWLLLHKSLYDDPRLLEQIRLEEHDYQWKTIQETQASAQAMMERQLTWIKHLLS